MTTSRKQFIKTFSSSLLPDIVGSGCPMTEKDSSGLFSLFYCQQRPPCFNLTETLKQRDVQVFLGSSSSWVSFLES